MQSRLCGREKEVCVKKASFAGRLGFLGRSRVSGFASCGGVTKPASEVEVKSGVAASECRVACLLPPPSSRPVTAYLTVHIRAGL